MSATRITIILAFLLAALGVVGRIDLETELLVQEEARQRCANLPDDPACNEFRRVK